MKATALAALGLCALPAAAQRITQAGYVRGIAVAYDLGYGEDLPGINPRGQFLGAVFRHQWAMELGPSVRAEAHARVQGTWWPSGVERQVVGFGVSAVPQRANLSETLTEGEHGSVVMDMDRLAFTFRTRLGDLIVGRQAVTWGLAFVFPVADLWAQFSPFELDTEQKPGTDAVRFLSYPASSIELDFVAADRGAARDFSWGARASMSLASADVYAAAGKFWREAVAMGGIAAVTGSWKFRAEAALPYDLDAGEMRHVRATVGMDRIGARWQASIEYHHNGLGSRDAGDYAALLRSPALARGETYYLGRDLLGMFGNWQAADRWTVSLGSLINVDDPSVGFLPSVTWDVGQAYRLIAGGLWSFGAKPFLTLPGGINLGSEFGTYGRYGYLQGAFYY